MSENIRIQSELNTDLEVYRLKGELLQLREQNRVLREAAKQAMDLIHADIVQGDKAGRRLKAESLLFAALTATSQEGQG